MDAWVDFNDVRRGMTTTLRKWVKEPVAVGDELTVGDFDGNRCQGTVKTIVRGIVKIELDMSSFNAEKEAA